MSAGLGTSDISAAIMLGWGWSLTPVFLASGVAVPEGVPVPDRMGAGVGSRRCSVQGRADSPSLPSGGAGGASGQQPVL